MNFGGVIENVVTREEFSLAKAREADEASAGMPARRQRIDAGRTDHAPFHTVKVSNPRTVDAPVAEEVLKVPPHKRLAVGRDRGLHESGVVSARRT